MELNINLDAPHSFRTLEESAKRASDSMGYGQTIKEISEDVKKWIEDFDVDIIKSRNRFIKNSVTKFSDVMKDFCKDMEDQSPDSNPQSVFPLSMEHQ